MATPMTAAQARAQMKKWGVPYKEFPGWTTRTRPGGFAPVGIVMHHTGSDAGQSDDYLNFLFVRGRPEDGIPGPLCNVATDMDGDLHLGAIGRANHAGAGSSAVLSHVKAEDYSGYTSELKPGPDSINGNGYYYGNEMRYDGGQPPTAKMYATAVRWAAAVCDFHGWTALSVISHREHTRRKRDPGNCPMNKFRTDLAAVLKQGPKPSPVTGEPSVSDINYAHIHAKDTAVKLEGVMTKLAMTPPTRPPVTDPTPDDAYYAHYWAKHASNLATLIDAKVTTAPKA